MWVPGGPRAKTGWVCPTIDLLSLLSARSRLSKALIMDSSLALVMGDKCKHSYMSNKLPKAWNINHSNTKAFTLNQGWIIKVLWHSAHWSHHQFLFLGHLLAAPLLTVHLWGGYDYFFKNNKIWLAFLHLCRVHKWILFGYNVSPPSVRRPNAHIPPGWPLSCPRGLGHNICRVW